jgi:hypothetical protein
MQQPFPSPMDYALSIIHGRWKERILSTFVELSIPSALTDGKKTTEQIAEITQTQPHLMRRFLRAACATGLLRQLEPGIFEANEITLALLPGSPTYSVIKYHTSDVMFSVWAHILSTLQTGTPALNSLLGTSWWNYLETNADANTIFHDCMYGISLRADLPIAQAYNFDNATIVDVGGGEGGMLSTILHHSSGSKGFIFDLPVVREQADKNIEKNNLSDRCFFIEGSFFDEENSIPRGDIYIMKNVIHDYNDQDSIRILSAIRRAAQPDSTLLIAEMLLPQLTKPQTFPVEGLDLEMMLTTGGQQRSAEAIATLLKTADWKFQEVIPVRGPIQLVKAI